jgi:hypothetical protein
MVSEWFTDLFILLLKARSEYGGHLVNRMVIFRGFCDTISLLMSSLLRHRPSLWITLENRP